MYLIIPAHNEAKRISPTLRDYLQYFPDIKIIVVLSNCTDKTEAVVDAVSKQYLGRVFCLSAPKIKGNTKGWAVRTGINYVINNTNSDFVGFIDADNSVSPNQFEKLTVWQDKFEVIVSSRYLPDSQLIDRDSNLRKLGAYVFRKLVRLLFKLPVVDTQCGGKVFKTAALKEITNKLAVNDMTFDVEILFLLHRAGYQIKEVPVVWRENSASTISTSQVNFLLTSVQMLWSLLKIRSRNI